MVYSRGRNNVFESLSSLIWKTNRLRRQRVGRRIRKTFRFRNLKSRFTGKDKINNYDDNGSNTEI